MGTIRKPSLFSLFAVGVALTACGPPGGLVTASEVPKKPRQPDGVLVDPSPAVPPALLHAPAKGVINLAEPTSNETLFGLVTTFFTAFQRRDRHLIEEVLSADAVGLDPAQHQNRQAMVQDWDVRMRSHDYSLVKASDLARVERMERFEYEDMGVSSSYPRPPEMRPGDVLIRVPVTAPLDPKSGDKLFHDLLILMIRPDGEKLTLAGIAEVDTP